MNKKLLSLLVASTLACSIQMVSAEIKTSQVEPESATETEKQAQYAWLGVAIEPVPIVLAKHFTGMLKDNQGIMIRMVKPGSPAEKADLEPYDVISGFNDQEVYTTQQFSHLIRASKPGTTVKLQLIRQSQLQTQEVTLEAQTRMQQIHPHGHRPYTPFLPQHAPFSPPRGFDQFPSPQRRFESRSSFRNRYSQPAGQSHFWSEFESVQMESIGPDKYKAAVKYEDGDGNKQDFIFEGRMDEIFAQIQSHQTLPENKKRSLLQALDTNINRAPSMPAPWQALPDPGWFRQNQLPVPPGYRYNY